MLTGSEFLDVSECEHKSITKQGMQLVLQCWITDDKTIL
jgi:hypothetical protein